MRVYNEKNSEKSAYVLAILAVLGSCPETQAGISECGKTVGNQTTICKKTIKKILGLDFDLNKEEKSREELAALEKWLNSFIGKNKKDLKSISTKEREALKLILKDIFTEIKKEEDLKNKSFISTLMKYLEPIKDPLIFFAGLFAYTIGK